MPPAVAIIPARLGSTRFPGKALAAETGTPMVVHVCQRTALAGSVSRVAVATDAQEIAEAVRSAGFEAVMTGDHDNGTSRVAQAAEKLGLKPQALIVNVQGDEPEIDPGLIDAAIDAATGPDIACGTVAAPFAIGENPNDPNIVKAVVGLLDDSAQIGLGLYFTRANAPYRREPGAKVPPLKHIGLYAYTLSDLRGYLALRPGRWEHAEKLEQLRWLEHGLAIAVAVREAAHHGIDTPEQYAEFVARWNARNST
ncbi:MAG: 3-deoxy-manno-octulosonate cytidylyltransferase [Planctomycetota bacterium]